MNVQSLLTVLLLLASGLTGCAAVETPVVPPAQYVLDADRSTVTFTIDHRGRPLDGRFRVVNAALTPATASRPGQLYAAVAAGSIDTAVALRDAHLRTGDFFDVTQHPGITFDGTVTEGDTLTAEGELTLLGVTQPLTVQLEPIVDADFDFAHRCRFTIQRSAFGMTHSLDNGLIGDDVTLHVELCWTQRVDG